MSIDARITDGGNYECFSHCGTSATGKPADSWAREVEQLGAGEILITSIERDGTMQGYDLDLIRWSPGTRHSRDRFRGSRQLSGHVRSDIVAG